MYAYNSSGCNVHNDSRRVIIQLVGTLTENLSGSKLGSRSFSCINQKSPEHLQSRVWEGEGSWEDSIHICRYGSIRARGCNSWSFFFWIHIIVIITIEPPRFFHSKLALTHKCNYSLLKEEKSCVCLRASHAIAQLYTFMIIGLL